jgi:hypothetical protein
MFKEAGSDKADALRTAIAILQAGSASRDLRQFTLMIV